MKGEEFIDQIIELALSEDIGSGDATTNSIVSEDQKSKALIFAKQKGIVCGLEIAEKLFKKLDPNMVFEKLVNDGDWIEKGNKLVIVEGKTRALLTAERTALNFLQQLSGIATRTNEYVEKMGETKTRLLDTRKTTPGLRYPQKHAVKCGGGKNHRIGLHDLILIKDNHIQAAGSVTNAITKTKDTGLRIEVECKTLDQVKEALGVGVDIIMLDNFTPERVKEAIEVINGAVEIELSGGINFENIGEYSHLGADFISSGALTHHIISLDISMDFVE